MAGIRRTKRRRDGKAHSKVRYWFMDQDGRRQWGSGTSNEKETLQFAQRLEDQHRQIRLGLLPRPKAPDKPRPYAEIVDEYLRWGEMQGGRGGRPWAVGHCRMRRTHLKWWGGQLKVEMLGDLQGSLGDVERALQVLRKAGSSGKTISNYAEALAAFCDWCVNRDYLSEDPLKNLARFDITPKVRRRAMTSEEIRRFLEVAGDLKLLCETAFCTGLRANELRSVCVRHLDIERQGLTLDAAWTKNRKPGFQPLPGLLVEHLEAVAKNKRADEPLLQVPSHPAREVDKILLAADIEKRTQEGKLDFHALRNAYITLISETGASWKDTQDLARHQTPMMTERYARSRTDHLRSHTEAVGRIVLASGDRGTGVQLAEEEAEPTSAIPDPARALDEDGVVEAAGIEPASRNGSSQTSTRVVGHLCRPGTPGRQGVLEASPIDLAASPRAEGVRPACFCGRPGSGSASEGPEGRSCIVYWCKLGSEGVVAVGNYVICSKV